MARSPRHIFWWLMALGCALRLSHSLTPRALWLDEAMLAVSLYERELSGLMQPLDYFQSAPLGWLWLQKAVILALGSSDWALRLWPLLASLLTLPLLYRLYCHWQGKSVALLGLGLAACTYILIFYAAEAKPYQTDVLAATLLLLGLQAWPEGPRRLWWLGSLGLLLPWFSLPAVLIMAPLGLVWIWERWQQRRALWPIFIIGVGWLASAAGHVLLRPQSAAGLSFMQVFWQGDMLPNLWQRSDGWYWLAVHLIDPFESWVAAPVWLGVALAMAAALGAWRSWRARDGKTFPLILGPLLFAAALSAFGLYALRGRLLLFALPGLWLWVASGLDELSRLLPAQRRGWALLLTCALVGGGPIREIISEGNLGPRQALDQAMRWVRSQHQPGQQIYLHHASEPAARIYGPRILAPELSWQTGACYMNRWDGCIQPVCLDSLFAQNWHVTRRDLSTLHGEVWLLFSHVPQSTVRGFASADELITDYVHRRGGHLRQQQTFAEAKAICYWLP